MVAWKPRHIDLGRETSIMHIILSTQLRTLNLSESTKQAIYPLPTILEAVTKASEEDEVDPLGSTFEALRVMQTTIKQFNNNSDENSESSSEYTTPAQSQATSPSHEQSPPPPGVSVQVARFTVGSAAQVFTSQNNTRPPHEPSPSSSSPNTSPTHCDRVSSLATHSHMAVTTRSRSSHSSNTLNVSDRGSGDSETHGNSSRRKSETDVQRHRVRPSSATTETSIK